MLLNRIPSLIKRPRRESVGSFDIVKLLVVLRVIRNGIGLSWVLNTAGNEPRNDVRDLLFRHRFARHVSAPVWGAQLRTASYDDRAQSLIADQREKRTIRDSAAF